MALTAREQRQIYERLVDSAGRDVADAFLQAVQQANSRVNIRQLAEAIEAGDLRQIEMLLRFDQGALFPLQEAMRSAFVQGGLSAARIVGGAFAFDGRNPRAEAFIARQGGNLVQGIETETRELLRQIMQERLARGEGGAKTARKLVGSVNRATGRREGGFIGLSSQQAQWALNAERELESLDANYFTRAQRDKRFDALVKRAIKDGKPLAQADIDRIGGRYRDKLLKYRGEVIARTEAHKASSAGQWEGFEQLAAQGVAISKRWVWGFSREPRRDHQALSLSPSRLLLTPFVTADGVQMRYPHDDTAPASETIGCKCSVFYRVVS